MKISSEIALVNVWKYWKTGWNAKQFCEPLSTKHFAQLRIPYTFLISFVSPFVGISLTSPDRSFISFVQEVTWLLRFVSGSTFLFLFEVTFLGFWKICLLYEISNINLHARFPYFNLSAIFFRWIIKFGCSNIFIMVSYFLFNFYDFCIVVSFID